MFWLPKEKHAVIVSPSIVVFTVFFLLALYFLYYIQAILILIFLAFIIMTALRPSVDRLHRYLRIPRPFSIAIVYILMISIISAILGFLIPPLVNQMYSLVKALNFPILQQQVTELKFTLTEISALADRVGNQAGMLFSVISSTFSGIFTFFTLIVLSFYLMLDRPALHKKIGWFTRKKSHIELAKTFIDEVELQLGGWIRGQLILMVVIGVITYIGLVLIGVPYALPLAILAGVLEILPNLGPTIAAIPAIILAYLSLGPVMAGVMLLFSVVVQQLENTIIVPKIMKDNADVNPLVSIVSILIGLEVAGVVGALLAVPTYIVLRCAYSMWLQHHPHTD